MTVRWGRESQSLGSGPLRGQGGCVYKLETRKEICQLRDKKRKSQDSFCFPGPYWCGCIFSFSRYMFSKKTLQRQDGQKKCAGSSTKGRCASCKAKGRGKGTSKGKGSSKAKASEGRQEMTPTRHPLSEEAVFFTTKYSPTVFLVFFPNDFLFHLNNHLCLEKKFSLNGVFVHSIKVTRSFGAESEVRAGPFKGLR